MLPVKIWNLENADENDEFCEAMNADPGIRMKVCVDWDLDGMKAYRKAENVYYLSPDMMREFVEELRGMQTNEEQQCPSTLDVQRAASLWYPVMLAQERGELSENRAAELLGLSLTHYRYQRETAIECVMILVKSLPSPCTLLAAAIAERQKS